MGTGGEGFLLSSRIGEWEMSSSVVGLTATVWMSDHPAPQRYYPPHSSFQPLLRPRQPPFLSSRLAPHPHQPINVPPDGTRLAEVGAECSGAESSGAES